MARQGWFAPNIIQAPDGRATPNLATLFDTPADWASLVGKVDVFQLFMSEVGTVDDGGVKVDYLTAAVARIAQIGAVLGLESGGPLGNNNVACGASSLVNAVSSADLHLARSQKVYDRGGTVQYMVLDTFHRGIINGDNPCGSGYTIQQTADAIPVYMDRFHQTRPETKMGLMVQVNLHQSTYTGTLRPGRQNSTQANQLPDIKELLDAVYAAVDAYGERLHFVHTDSPYESAFDLLRPTDGRSDSIWTGADDWAARIKACADQAHAAGLRFGVGWWSRWGGGTESVPDPLGFGSDWFFQMACKQYVERWDDRFGLADVDNIFVESFYQLPDAIVPNGSGISFTETYLDVLDRITTTQPRYLIDGQNPVGLVGSGYPPSATASAPRPTVSATAPRPTVSATAPRPTVSATAPRPR